MEGTTENTGLNLEGMLSEGSQEVSQEVKDDSTTTNDNNESPEAKGQETPQAGEVPEGEGKEGEKPVDEKKYSYSELKSAVDKQTNSYREKHELYIAQNKELQTKLKEVTKQLNTRETDKAIESILADDEDKGIAQEDTEKRRAKLKEFSDKYTEYREKADEVNELAQVIDGMKVKLDPAIVKQFSLDESNSSIRIMNGVNLITDAVTVLKRDRAYSDVLEVLVPKGSEVRTKIDNFVKELADLSKDAYGLKLNEIKQGLKITPKEAPKKPSNESTGKSLSEMDSTSLIARGLRKMKK